MELMMLRKGVIKIIEAAQKKNYKIVKDGNAVTITKEFSGDYPRVSVTLYRDGSYVRNGPFVQNFPIRTLRLIRDILEL